MTVRLSAPQLTVVPAGVSLHVVSDYLEQQFPDAEISLRPLTEEYRLGINSHVFVVTVQDGLEQHQWLLKCVTPRDPKALKKFYTEVAFYHYCQRLSATLPVPQLRDADPQKGFLLLSFVQGKSPQTATEQQVVECFEFIEQLNRGNDYERQKLPLAADAQAGLADVVADVNKRLARKNHLLPRDDASQPQAVRDCYHFLLIDFIPAWQTWCEQQAILISKHSVALDAVSPSDFGLHNSLQLTLAPIYHNHVGSLIFFDFEYAGRDSYWKLLADMLAQPKIPLPVEAVIRQAAASRAFEFAFTQSNEFLAFLHATLCKWVLIQLNCFFAIELPHEQQLIAQLNQAKSYWQGMTQRIADVETAIRRHSNNPSGVVITGVQFS